MTNQEAAVPRYAQALFGAAQKAGELEKVAEDLRELERVMKPSGLKSYLENPRHPAERKRRVVASLRPMLRSRLTEGFLLLLLEKSRVEILYGVARRYSVLVDEAMGVVPAEVTLAGAPNEAFKRRIEASLAKITGKKVKLAYKSDPDIVGGIRIRIGNSVIDGSIRERIAQLKTALLETKIN